MAGVTTQGHHKMVAARTLETVSQ